MFCLVQFVFLFFLINCILFDEAMTVICTSQMPTLQELWATMKSVYKCSFLAFFTRPKASIARRYLGTSRARNLS